MLNFEQPYPPLLVHSETPSSFIVVIILGTFAVVTVLARLCRAYVVYKKLLLEDYAIILAIRQAFSILYAIFIALVVLSGPGLAADDLASEELRNFSRDEGCLIDLRSELLCIEHILMHIVGMCEILSNTVLNDQVRATEAVLRDSGDGGPLDPDYGVHHNLAMSSKSLHPWAYRRRYYFTKVSDMVTDVAIALLPAVLVSKVQMPMSKRLRVGLIYATRLVTVVFTAMSLNSLSGYYHADITKRPAQAVSSSTWASIALWVSIMTACLPHILNPSLVAA
ncbi:hypothetical protein LTR56_027787, partial [Elasticomyces elasticus]